MISNNILCLMEAIAVGFSNWSLGHFLSPSLADRHSEKTFIDQEVFRFVFTGTYPLLISSISLLVLIVLNLAFFFLGKTKSLSSGSSFSLFFPFRVLLSKVKVTSYIVRMLKWPHRMSVFIAQPACFYVSRGCVTIIFIIPRPTQSLLRMHLYNTVRSLLIISCVGMCI